MKNVVAYCRVSTDGQLGDDKFGIDSQKSQIIEYCEKNDMRIIDWFVDEGVSGAEIRRPALDRLLMGEITNPPVAHVVMAKTDRLARDINLYYTFKSALNKLGLEIISVSEDWSAQDRLTAMILENFLAMAATLERENIRVRTMGGRKMKARQGGYSGGRAPYGYNVIAGKLVVDLDAADTVRQMFAMKDAGYTLQQITDAVNKLGRKNKSGGRFAISTVQTIIGNRQMYRGMYKYGKNGEWVQGQHEPILKEDV
jgi:site-specific DNA recombinase